MKTILSAGGPLVGLELGLAKHWSGIDGKRFFSNGILSANDYEAACDPRNGVIGRPRNIDKISGITGEALLIAMPLQTAVIDSDGNHVLIAQIDVAEENWSFTCLTRKDFDAPAFKPRSEVFFSVPPCGFVFFDASNSWDWVGHDILQFNLNGGNYRFTDSFYDPDEQTSLILYKIVKCD